MLKNIIMKNTVKVKNADRQRKETRRARYNQKLAISKIYPVEIACVNFNCPDNVGYLIRAAACFGAAAVNVIGKLPDYRDLRKFSGTTNQYVRINQFANPHEFLEYTRANKIKLIAAELNENSTSIYNYDFRNNEHICVVVGNETIGVPPEILFHSEIIHIPMPGPGFCLNTAITGNIFLYEATKQFAL
jgi:tRNA G18 (ribose-2'-O)-methylase SpoU